MAERFAAAAQVMLAALANEELCLLPTRITVDLKKRPRRSASTRDAEALPSNDGRAWIVRLTPFNATADVTSEEFTRELVEVLAQILREASLLPDEEFMTTIERAFQRGLGHKLSPPRPYDELVAAFAPGEGMQIPRGVWEAPWSLLGGDYPPHAELAWQEGPGPTYSEDQARELLDSRYQNLARSLRKTIPKLQKSTGFLKTVSRLRSEGWLDWHILIAILNISLQHRYPSEPRQLPEESAVGQLWQAAHDPESDDAKLVPVHRLTRRALQGARRLGILPLLEHWDLEIHQRTPDIPAIERLLAARYGYWTDDSPHDDPFPAAKHAT